MDPQKLSQLDPKLREAYQRVMGASVSQPQAQPPTTIPTTPAQPPNLTSTSPVKPQSISTSIPIEDKTPFNPIKPPEPPVQPKPAPQSIPQNPSPQTISFDQMNSEVSSPSSPNFTQPEPQAKIIPVKKKNKFMPILIGIVGLVLIAAYTFLWTKIFNLKLPFLP
ncbi:MAG: hypothetical protein HY424_01820 [Candidatus Levybacteria bacterium]|nr:hypothetical protein [Candidatus Levybacteria bacterium]